MNRYLDGDQELIVVDNASTDAPLAAAASGRASTGSSRSSGTSASAPPRTSASARPPGRSPCCSTPTPSCSTTASTGSRPRRCGAGRWSARGCSTPIARSSRRRAAPRSAPGPGCGRWCRPRSSRRAIRARTEPYRARASARGHLAHGRLHRRADRGARRLGPFDPALHMFGEDVDLGLRARPPGSRSWFDPSLPDRPPRPGLVDARLRLARGLAADRDAQLARGAAPRLRAAARMARLARPARSTCGCG